GCFYLCFGGGWCCVAINKVLSRFEYLQAGAAPHHAAGSTQMLVADAKAGLTMGAAGNVYGHEQSLAFNPCKNNAVILLLSRGHIEPLAVAGRHFFSLLGQQAGQRQFTA